MQKNRYLNKYLKLILPFIIPVLIILFWFISSEFDLIKEYLLPSPKTVFRTGMNYFFGISKGPYSARFINDFYVSLLRVLTGFSVACVSGLGLGLLTGRRQAIKRLFSGIINALRAVPGITWLPLALIWLGIGMKTTVFLISLAAFFPVYLNTHSAVEQFDEKLLQAGEMMGVSKRQKVLFILLPGISPQILTGLRLGLGISWAYLVLGELTGVTFGLGAVIMDARLLGRTDMIIIGIITIAVIGKLSDLILVKVLKLSFKSIRRLVK